MSAKQPPALISRSTILILCAVLTGMAVYWELTPVSQFNALSAGSIGIISFLVLDSQAKRRQIQAYRRWVKTQVTLNRRMDDHVAVLLQMPHTLPVRKDLFMAKIISNSLRRLHGSDRGRDEELISSGW